MTWFEHLKYRWKFSRCKTNLEVLRVWTEAMMEYKPRKITKDTDIWEKNKEE